jgi:osmotically-inducible protein OsmY
MHAMKGFVLGVGAAYLFDPTSGRGRRRKLVDQAARLGQRTGRYAVKRARFGLGRLRGAAASVMPSNDERKRRKDDATVLQRIRSNALRDVGLSPTDLDVRVENGVATLRGTVPTAKLAEDLLVRVRQVPGVEDVAAMIHIGDEASGAAG